MRTLEEYKALHYPVQITEDPSEGGYVVSFPDLPGCLTCEETLEEAMENAEDAKRCRLEVAYEEGCDIQEPGTWDNLNTWALRLRIPKNLHKSLESKAKEEGVDFNTYCVYLLARQDALEETKPREQE